MAQNDELFSEMIPATGDAARWIIDRINTMNDEDGEDVYTIRAKDCCR